MVRTYSVETQLSKAQGKICAGRIRRDVHNQAEDVDLRYSQLETFLAMIESHGVPATCRNRRWHPTAALE